MKIEIGKAYEKLKTDFIKVRVGRETLITNDHIVETDEDGECLVVARVFHSTQVVLVCSTDREAEVLEDRIRFVDNDGQRCVIQFLETRPLGKLMERLLL